MTLDALLPMIAAGDASAFGRWVAGAEARVRLSLSRFASRVDVEAVVQETLLRVWQLAPKIEVRASGKGESSLRFAIRVARNLAIDELRRQRQDPTDAPTLEYMIETSNPTGASLVGSGTDGPPTDPLLRRAIERCVDKLPKKPRRVFDLRITSGGRRHDAELAAHLDMRTNTFLQNFGRARKLLVECLGSHGVQLDAHGRLRP